MSMDKKTTEEAIVWLQGVVQGYDKQIQKYKEESVDKEKIAGSEARRKLCKNLLDFVVEYSKKPTTPTNTAKSPQNALQSIPIRSVTSSITKEQLEQIELVLGLSTAKDFCRAALVADLPSIGTKEYLTSVLKELSGKENK